MQTWSEGAECQDETTVFRARAFQRDATAGNNQISGAIPRDIAGPEEQLAEYSTSLVLISGQQKDKELKEKQREREKEKH